MPWLRARLLSARDTLWLSLTSRPNAAWADRLLLICGSVSLFSHHFFPWYLLDSAVVSPPPAASKAHFLGRPGGSSG